MTNFPLQITFKDMEPSAALEGRIEEHASKLARFSSTLQRCEVTVATPHRHQHKGRLHEVHIRLTVPGREFVISKEHRFDPAHEDAYVAVRDAFNAAARQLEDFQGKRRDAHRRDVALAG